jgi:hypothetical protein
MGSPSAFASGALLALALWIPASAGDSVEPRPDPRPDPTPSATDPDPTLRPGSVPRLGAGAERSRAEALERALGWLAADVRARPDGSWATEDARVQLPGAVTSLSVLALMAGGSPPDRGPHGQRVGAAIDYLLSRAVLDPESPEVGFLGSLEGTDAAMHGHGLATLALAEAYAMSPGSYRGARLAKALPLAVGLITRTQGAEGAWYYPPRRVAEHEGSVTITLVQGLRAARNAGIEVDLRVIERADAYVRRSQADDGLFRYTLGSSQRTVALTAAAISTLNATGSYDDATIRAAVDAVWRELAQRERDGGRSDFPYYERFYLSQALWQLSDPSHFDRWYTDELARIVDTQSEDGSWSDARYGAAYATAVNCLFLALPDALLPIFRR